jgi:hypothetical protein
VAHAKRLAPAEGDVGNARFGDVAGELQGLLACQLIVPGAVRTGFLAAGDAARTAVVGQLPGEEQRSGIFLDRAARDGQPGTLR